MLQRKELNRIIAAIAAFLAVTVAIAVFWDEIYTFVTSVRDKIVRMLDAISQRTYIDHYDEFDEYTDFIEE